MNKIEARSSLFALGVALLILVSLTAVPVGHAQANGITSILDLQYPSTVVLQGGVAQVTVTFTVFFNYYHNPQGYLVFGVFDSKASTYAKGSAKSTPDACQAAASAQYPGQALCAIVAFASSGSESAVFTLTFNAPQQYALSAMSLIWDSTNLKSGNQLGTITRSDFTITVTGQAAITSSTAASSAATTVSTQSSSTGSTTSSTTNTVPATSMTTTTKSSTTSTQPTQDSTTLLGLIVLIVALVAVVGFVALRRRGAKPPPPPVIPMQSRQVQAQAQPSQTFCSNCGARLPPGDVFCGECGTHQK